MKAESISLFYREGSSDKVYQADLEEQNGGWVVNFAYGRRGSSLTTGSKTGAPISYDEAKHIFDKLVQSKTSKGYTVDPNGKVFLGAIGNLSEDTGVRPQLLNPIEDKDLEYYLTDKNWYAQEKFDGRRRLLFCQGSGSYGANRKGLKTDISDAVLAVIQDYPQGTILDGEDLGSKIVIFDVLQLRGDGPLGVYRDRLKALMSMWIPSGGVLEPAITEHTTSKKRQFLEDLRHQKAEGIVFKRADALYSPGRPNSGGSQVKYKFTESASCIVTSVHKSKRSVSVSVYDGPLLVPVGNVTIYPNQAIPVNGDIVEIKYLYFFPGGSLYQPVFLDKRDDLSPSDCILSKLKVKQSTEMEADQ